MMDIGIGRFIEMLEEHFGRFVARLILAVVAVTAVVMCGSLIWTNLLIPAAVLVELIENEPRGVLAITLSVAALLANGILLFVMVPLSIITRISLARDRRKFTMIRRKLVHHSQVKLNILEELINVWCSEFADKNPAAMQKRELEASFHKVQEAVAVAKTKMQSIGDVLEVDQPDRSATDNEANPLVKRAITTPR